MDGPDPNRSDLFGGAQERYAQKQTQPSQDQQGGYGGGGGGSSNSYGGYGEDRELTEEEIARNETRAIGQEIRETRKAGLDSLDRSLAMARGALGVAGETAQRLQEQRHRLERAGENLDHAAGQNDLAAEQTKELRKYNRSMFVPVAGNPFTSKKRMAAKQEEMLQRHERAREQRDQQREEALANDRTFAQNMESTRSQRPMPQRSAAANSKYIFNDNDSDEDRDKHEAEDQADEDNLNYKMHELGDVVNELGQRARAMNTEVDTHIRIIDRNIEKTDYVDTGIARNRNALNRIEKKG